MPIDPLIARGAQINNPANTLAQIAALRQRDMALAQDQQQQAQARQKFERDVANSDKADRLWDEGMADLDSGDPVRLEQGKVKILRADPQAGAVLLKAKKLDGGSESDIYGKVNPNDWTPASMAAFDKHFKETGQRNFDLLVHRDYAPPSPLVFNSAGAGLGVISRGGPTGPAGRIVTQLTTAEDEANARARAAGLERTATTGAEATATAQANLPKVEYQADQIIGTIEALAKHPGTRFLYGKYALSPIVPQTDQAGANSYLDQIGGQAFLQAFESLKGGGQITEIEGNKATQALTRLKDRKISYEEAQKAMQEFVTQARKGVALARQRASGATRGAGGAPAAEDPLGLR